LCSLTGPGRSQENKYHVGVIGVSNPRRRSARGIVPCPSS
jgi:hypothetical protein